MSNQYQYADVINNDEEVLRVDVVDEEIGVVYNPNQAGGLTWVGDYLGKNDFEFKERNLVTQNVAIDWFRREGEA